MKGEKTLDTYLKLSADEALTAYHGLEAAKIGNQLLKSDIGTIEVLDGNGDVGTVIKITFPPGTPEPGYMKVRFLVVDDVKHIKETEVFEGLKTLGFDAFHYRFEMIPIDADSSVVRFIIKYKMDDSKADLATNIKTDKLLLIAETFGKHLYDKKHGN